MFEKNPTKVAKHLGVTVETLRRWKAADRAPRAAMLALFYESRWGYSLLYTTAFNAETDARQEVSSLKRTNDALRVRIARLESLGNFESANEPIWKAL